MKQQKTNKQNENKPYFFGMETLQQYRASGTEPTDCWNVKLILNMKYKIMSVKQSNKTHIHPLQYTYTIC